MKKALVVLVLVILTFSCTAALATDKNIYEDNELGFSFEMPEDYEYQGDLIENTKNEMESIEAEELKNSMEEIKASYTKQLAYMGDVSSIQIIYFKPVAEAFNEMESALPEGVSSDEIDYYLVTEQERNSYLEEMGRGGELLNLLEFKIISQEMKDIGGKLCILMKSKFFSPEYNLDIYQYNLNFLYKDYIITIAYSNFDIEGTLNEQNAFEEFEQMLSTLEFDVVPSDKEAKFKSTSWIGAAVFIALTIGTIAAITILIRRKMNKSKIDRYMEMSKGENDEF